MSHVAAPMVIVPASAVSRPGDEPQVVDLPQPDGPEQRDEIAGLRGKAHAVDRRGAAPALGHGLETDIGHARPAPCRALCVPGC
jgi:hypothetical protein